MDEQGNAQEPEGVEEKAVGHEPSDGSGMEEETRGNGEKEMERGSVWQGSDLLAT